MVKYHVYRNDVAYKSHRKKRLAIAGPLEPKMSL